MSDNREIVHTEKSLNTLEEKINERKSRNGRAFIVFAIVAVAALFFMGVLVFDTNSNPPILVNFNFMY